MANFTYSGDEDIVLDTGRSIDVFLDVSLTDLEKTGIKQKARERAFNRINDDYLRGKTVIPAVHIPTLKDVEKDFVITDLLRGAFVQETPNRSEWAKDYEERAMDRMKKIRFGASAEDAAPDPENVGDGYIDEVVTNDFSTRTETWILRALDSTKFSVYGSQTGGLPQAQVGTKYPERDWGGYTSDYNFTYQPGGDMRFEVYPISFTIVAGDTAFSQHDKFIIKTYSSSFYKNISGRIIRG
jgi:hypothetical protein